MQRSFHATVKPFIGGLNTELSQVEETPQYTADELNCRTYPDGSRGRRYGMGIEQFGTTLYRDDNKIYSVYYWSNAHKNNVDLLVTQVGNSLVFKRANRPFSSQNNFATVDLTPYIIDTEGFNNSQMAYTTGAGYLIVANKYMDTILIDYNPNEETVVVTKPSFKTRDFEGMHEDIAVDHRPTEAEYTPAHQYNLMNQGWSLAEIDKFKQDVGDNTYPSNNLVWFVGKDSTGTFDVTTLLNKYFGNTPAPKGHYILDAITKARYELTGIFPDSNVVGFYKYLEGGSRNNGKRRNLWNSNKDSTPYSEGYIDIDNNPGKLISFFLAFRFNPSVRSSEPVGAIGSPFKFKLEGVNKATGQFETIFDWENVSCGSSGIYNLTKIFEGNTTEYTLLRLWTNSLNNGICVAEYRINTAVGDWNGYPSPAYNYRITDVNFLAGHFFYLLNNRLLFSQTVSENIDNFDKCYQDADPTSEEVSDIVDTDGGEIIFTALGKGVGLAKSTLGMLVFGDKATYAVVSGVAGNFTATSYTTQFLNSTGCHSKDSIIETEGAVYYWSPVGIIRISENTTTGISLITENISVGSIQTFYQNIPDSCRDRCRGVYDATNRTIYWYYPSDVNAENIYKYDACLVYDLKLNSFHPYKLNDNGFVCAPFGLPRPAEIIPEILLYAGDNIVSADNDTVIAKKLEQDFEENTSLCHLSKINSPDEYTRDAGGFVYNSEGNKIGGIVNGEIYPYNFRVDLNLAGESSTMLVYLPVIGDYTDDTINITKDYAVLGSAPAPIPTNEDIQTAGTTQIFNLIYDNDWKNSAALKYSLIFDIMIHYSSDFVSGTATMKLQGIKDGVYIDIDEYSVELSPAVEGAAGELNIPMRIYKPYKDKQYWDMEQYDDIVVSMYVDNCDYTVYNRTYAVALLKDHNTALGKLAYTEYNSRDFLDWQQYGYDSYMVSFPIIATDTMNYKQTPIIQTIFTRTEEETLKDGSYIAPSGCQYRTRWSWSIGDQSNRWDMMQKCYFVPSNYKNFKYLTSKIVVRGWGKAFQIELRNIDNKDMRIAGINTLVRGE